jgi:pimeloyl-ACP methyl ester carboxylesterase
MQDTAAEGHAMQLIFLHGLEGNSQGVKATLLRDIFPGIIIPDFSGGLEDRMKALEAILGERVGWSIIGSSFGGLMAALFALRHAQQVERLVLLAPALIWPDFAQCYPPEGGNNARIEVPTVIYHGIRDGVVPLAPVRALAGRAFSHLTFYEVEDDHGLYQTVHNIHWQTLLS